MVKPAARTLDVLVVDDDPTLTELMAEALPLKGPFRVRTANGGAEALRQVRKRHPDVIVLDLVMPEVDGTEVLRTLEAKEQTRSIPVIVLTALLSREDNPPSLLPNHTYLAKPTTTADVVAAIHRIRSHAEER